MNLDLKRLRQADRIVAIGAIALFILIFFFKWFGISIDGFGGSINGWHSLSIVRWLELLLIAGALGMAYLSATGGKLELPVSLSVLVAGLGALVTILLFYRVVISHPHQGDINALNALSHTSVHYSAKFGAYLAILAAAAITYGGYLGMTAEGTTLADVREQASGALGNVTAPASTSGAEDRLEPQSTHATPEATHAAPEAGGGEAP